MSGSVTYDGVVSAEEGGNIFQGKKFWLSQRVPQRSRFINQIKENGGHVVPLEKQADYLIADHARKVDVPPGAFSFKFIEDSIKNGILQVEDKYRIGRDPEIPRPAASGALRKGTRAPFTPAEDAALVKYILSNFSGPRTGNAVFQQWEQMDPRHTWQSWRNRWVKRLSLLPQHDLERIAATAETPLAQTSANYDNTQPESSSPKRPASKQANPPQAQPTPQPETAETESDDDEEGAAPDPNNQEQNEAAEIATRFYEDLDWYARNNSRTIPHKQPIAGLTIELFDLVTSVANHQDSSFVDWHTVASDLGFSEGDEIANQLEKVFEEQLKHFMQIMEELDDNGATQAQQDEAAEQPNPPSSPPALQKRPYEAEDGESARQKRRRLDRDAEIPSTPDSRLRVRRPAASQPSPSLRKRQHGHIVEVKDSQDDTQAALAAKSPRTPERRRTTIPDTYTVPRTQSLTQQSSVDITPSQQLRYENRLSESPDHREAASGRPATPELGTNPVPPQDQEEHLPSRKAKAPRRSLPSSFRRPPRNPSPDTHDPSNDPDPHPRRDTPNLSTIEGWVEHYQSMGYPHRIVVTALKSTTMTPGGLASHVMESIRQGKGIPTHHEGVWTSRDDKGLRLVTGDLERDGTDAAEWAALKTARKEHKRLLHKHGEQRMNLRKDFLAAQDQDALA